MCELTPSSIGKRLRSGRLWLAAFLLITAGWPIVNPAIASPPIRMAYLQNDLHHLALWVAIDRGYFQEEGIAVEIAGIFRAGPEIMTAFGAGDLDAAYVGEAPATIAAIRGTARIRVLAQVNTEGSALVVSNAFASGMKKNPVLAKPGIGTVQDLLLQKVLPRLGLRAGNEHTIVLSPPEMVNALQAGQIDGFVAWEPYPSRAEALKLGCILATSTEIWPGHPCCVLVASEALMKTRPEAGQALQRAHERATAFIKAHTDEAVAVAVRYTGMDQAVVRQALSRITYTDKLSLKGEEEFVAFLGALGYIEIDDPKAFTRRFLGSEPVEAAGR